MVTKVAWNYLCQDHFDLMEKNPRFTIRWFLKLLDTEHHCGACRQESKVEVAIYRVGYRYESR